MTAVIAERRGGKIINQQSPAIAGCVQLRRSSTDITSCGQSPPAVSQLRISPASVSHITCVVDSATSRDALRPINALPRQDGRLPVTLTAAHSATWSLIVVAESADVPDALRLCEPGQAFLTRDASCMYTHRACMSHFLWTCTHRASQHWPTVTEI